MVIDSKFGVGVGGVADLEIYTRLCAIRAQQGVSAILI